MAASVSYQRNDLALVLPRYQLIADCLSGSDRVKAQGETYLPMPNAADRSLDNQARYKAYKERALFYNVTKRTLSGLVGQVFARSPVVEVPEALKAIVEDCTGTGIDAEQQAKRVLSYILAYGRCGLLVDYPATEGGATKADIDAGNVRATIEAISPKNVVNWNITRFGAVSKLSLVVIAELYQLDDDGFEIKQGCRFRELRLDENGEYFVRLWEEPTPSEWDGIKSVKRKNFEIRQEFRPTGPNGEPLKDIPFMFVGSENNDTTIDEPPLYDMACVNIAHYRNSADYEEACFVTGQPTVWFSGMTEEWMKNVLGGQIRLGSWGGIPLPSGANAGILQIQANTMPMEAMAHKEQQMVALGAKLVEQKTVQRTATEALQDEAGEHSALSASAKNVSAAMEWAFGQCAMFENVSDATIKFELNTDFDLSKMDANERAETIKEWQGGALTFTEMRAVLRRAGVATLDDAQAESEIASEMAAQIEAAAKVPSNNVGNNNQSGV